MSETPRPSQPLSSSYHDTKVVVFTVHEWPEVDPEYTSVLLRLPGGYEARMSGPDAQRLGQHLNKAGGGQ